VRLVRNGQLPRWAVVGVLALPLLMTACGGGSGSSSAKTPNVKTSSTQVVPPQNSQSQSATISLLQNQLNALNCRAGPFDGKLGPQTLAAIKAFQAVAGLTVDGIVGPKTANALAVAAAAGHPTCPNPAPTPTTKPTTATTRPTPTTAPVNPVVCTAAAITPAIQASLLPNQTLVSLGSFECAKNFAVADPVIETDGQQAEVTTLLIWSGKSWTVVDRALYCENGVPAEIYQRACQSN
jgi:peptidoglycan hydrolase-like protein with peptidoglycan-binding domain